MLDAIQRLRLERRIALVIAAVFLAVAALIHFAGGVSGNAPAGDTGIAGEVAR